MGQRIIDPLAGAPRDEDGAIVYTVTEDEMKQFSARYGEEDLKKEYEKLTAAADVWDVDPEDEDAWRAALLDDLVKGERTPFKVEEFQAVLDKELAVFKNGEKYDYVKDIKDAYKESLKAPLETRIFKTLPDHV